MVKATKDPHHITLEPTTDRVTVRIDGVTVASTTRATILREGSIVPRYYMPIEDVDATMLRPSDRTSHCPFKGDATYRSLEVNGVLHEHIVWTYEEPFDEMADIAHLVCFYNERTDITVE